MELNTILLVIIVIVLLAFIYILTRGYTKVRLMKFVFVVSLICLIGSGFFLTHIIKNFSSVALVTQKQVAEKKAAFSFPLLKDRQNLIVLTSFNKPPYSYRENNEDLGFEVELLKQAFGVLGKNVIFKYVEEDKLLNALANHEGDIAVNNFYQDKIEGDTRFSGVSEDIVTPSVLLALKSTVDSFSVPNEKNPSLADILSTNKIGVMQNSFLKEYLEKLGSNTFIATSKEELLNALRTHQVDFILVDVVTYNKDIKNSQNTDIIGFDKFLGDLNNTSSFINKSVMVVNAKDDDLKNHLSEAMDIVKNQGYVTNLSLKYFNINLVP